MRFRNFTPHSIVLNDGRVFESEGVARISSTHTSFEDDVCFVSFGEPVGLPEAEEGVLLIVSGMLASACKDRTDLVSPATGHPACVRNDKGQIVSVPGFVIG